MQFACYKIYAALENGIIFANIGEMKPHKRIKFISAFFTVSIFLAALCTSCIKNKCNGKVCLNGGVCVDGACACVIGYEGDICATAWSQKFSGDWNSDDTYIKDTSHTHFHYQVTITGTADSFQVSGLSDSLNDIICKRESLNTFSMKPLQILKPDSSVIIASGNGSLENGIVKGIYSLRLKDTTITANFKWSK